MAVRIEDEFFTYEISDGMVIAGPVTTRYPADPGRLRSRGGWRPPCTERVTARTCCTR